MRDTLEVGDRVIVSKLTYRFGDVERGDVVVFRSAAGEDGIGERIGDLGGSFGLGDSDEDFIKRVIALPGETVEIRRDRVFVDGVRIDEPYRLDDSRMRNMEEVVVPREHYFVMGDNRGASIDSRQGGPIHESQIVGRATLIGWPPGRWGRL